MPTCPKPEPSLLRKRALAAETEKAWRACKARVRRRDGNVCRLCGRHAYPDPHHILEKSLGGRDEDRNIVCLCRPHHDEAQAHLIRITGNPERAGELAFTVDARVSLSGREETHWR